MKNNHRWRTIFFGLTLAAVLSQAAFAAGTRLNSTPTSTSNVQFEDPYAEFRNARYSNDGLLTEREEIRLGQQLHREATKHFRLTDVGLARVDRLGQQMAKAGLRPGLVYKFHVIEEREINGFSLPGGHIYITTGLLKVANDNELSSVLAHEVGHIVARHSLKSLKQRQGYNDIANALGSVTGIAGDTARDLGTSLGKMIGEGFMTIHSQDEEREADYLGVHAMRRAGIDPQAMISMFQKLRRISGEEYSLLGSFFSDHPDMKERVENTRYEIARMRSQNRLQ